jgi:hypothetical protein
MGKSQRTKGAVGEREVFRLLSEELGFVVTRNVDQARKGGADCINLPGFSPEVKRREVLSRPSWWRQAVRQGAKDGKEPIVWYRRNREEWRALIVGTNGEEYRDVSWAESLDYVREKLSRLFGIYTDKRVA